VGALAAAGRLWNRLTAAPPGSLLRATFDVSCQLAATAPATLPLARQSGAAQLVAALQGIGMPGDLARPRPLCLEQLKRSALRRHLHEIQASAGRPSASKLPHYLAAAWGRQLPGAEEYGPCLQRTWGQCGIARAGWPQPSCSRGRTGWQRRRQVGAGAPCAAYLPPLPGRARGCAARLFLCSLYSPVSARFLDLVFEPTVHAFLEQDPVLIAAFVAECQRTHAAAATTALGRGRSRAQPLKNSGATVHYPHVPL
jgi:hypothetical protein